LFSRQITAERKALAFEAGSHQGQGDGGGADERHHAEAGMVRRLDQRGPGVGDRRAAGFGQQAQRSTFLKRFKQRSEVVFQRVDIQFADRAGHSRGGKESARALRVLDGEVAQRLTMRSAGAGNASAGALPAGSEWRRGSTEHGQAGPFQHFRERDQGQADERRRVLGLHARR